MPSHRRNPALPLLLLLLAACGKPQDDLVGTWVVDVEATTGMSSPIDLGGLFGQLDLDVTITADRMNLNLLGKRVEGPYEVVESGGGRYVVEVEADGTRQRVVLTREEDHLLFAGEDGKQVALKRKQ